MGDEAIYDALEPTIHHEIAEAVDGIVTVLDIACGEGRLTSFLASKSNGKVYGVDVSITSLIQAREVSKVKELSLMVEFVAGDADNLCFIDDCFGSITMLYCLHEIENSRQSLEEAYRVLKKDGKLVIVDFTRGGKAEKIWNENYYELAEIESMIQQAGFTELGSKSLYEDITLVEALKG